MRRGEIQPFAFQLSDGVAAVRFKSGQSLTFPIKGNARLERGTAAQLNNVELSPFPIHWPDLDDDLSFEGVMRGEIGQR